MAAYDSSYWSDDLIPDLLVLIFSRLELVDFIRAAATCRSWWQLKSRWKDFHVRPKNQIPWLMLCSPTPFETQSHYFHSLLPSSHPHEIRLPESTGLFCIGSSQGFLFFLDQATADLRAFNPITGTHIPLPPTSTLAPHLQPNHLNLNIQEFWFGPGKAILSPDAGLGGRPQTAALIYFENLAFAQSGDCKWTLLAKSLVFCFSDILFHKNRLHAVNWVGTLAAFDLRDPSVPHSLALLCERLPSEKMRHTKRRYLVESPDGHDLYFVTRSVEDLFSLDPRRRAGFWVYKLDELQGQWIEVDSLGDLALFLGFNHSLALSATDHPSIKRNSIYFTSEFVGNTGVFDLADRSIQLLSLSDHPMCNSWKPPPPIWFTPAL